LTSYIGCFVILYRITINKGKYMSLTSFKISLETNAILNAYCKRVGLSKSHIINMSIAHFFDSGQSEVNANLLNFIPKYPLQEPRVPSRPLIYNRKALVTQATKPEPIPGMTNTEYSELLEDWQAFQAGEIDY
jgi:hypothetical protein